MAPGSVRTSVGEAETAAKAAVSRMRGEIIVDGEMKTLWSKKWLSGMKEAVMEGWNEGGSSNHILWEHMGHICILRRLGYHHETSRHYKATQSC
jgi:hypothetical protein